MDHVYVQRRDDGGLLMHIKGVVRSPLNAHTRNPSGRWTKPKPKQAS